MSVQNSPGGRRRVPFAVMTIRGSLARWFLLYPGDKFHISNIFFFRVDFFSLPLPSLLFLRWNILPAQNPWDLYALFSRKVIIFQFSRIAKQYVFWAIFVFNLISWQALLYFQWLTSRNYCFLPFLFKCFEMFVWE